MTKLTNKVKYLYVICLVVILLGVLLGASPAIAYADATRFSSVLDDLRADDNFDVGLYPTNSRDYSISVIQIAESVDKELFVYTYQPCNRANALTATKINMALSQDVNTTQSYNLLLVSREGVFCKYLVEDLTVTDATVRYYNITSIYRKWLNEIDSDVDNDNTVSDVAYKVAQCWKVHNFNDTVTYDMAEQEVITITEQMIGYRRYYNGFTWNSNKSVDAHFLAFSCDHNIDKLLSAKVEYCTQAWKHTTGQSYKYEEKQKQVVDLYDYQVASTGKSGWFGTEAQYHRMNSTQAYVEEVGIKDEEEKAKFLKYDWILNFCETEIECDGDGSSIAEAFGIPFFGVIKAIYDGCTKRGVDVTDVSLLRLEFEYDGVIYDMGVVSNTQTGSNTPTNTTEKEKFNLLTWLEDKTGLPSWVWIALICLIPLAILMPVLSAIFPAFGEVLKSIIKGIGIALKYLFKRLGYVFKYLFKGFGYVLKYFFIGLWWIICLPVKVIKALIEKIKERKEQ